MNKNTNCTVKILRKSLNLTLEKFCEPLGVGKSSISRIESGTNALSERMLKSIARVYGVSEDWLRTGEGEMRPVQTDAERLGRFFDSVASKPSDDFERRFVSSLSKLTPEQWAYLQNIIGSLLSDRED